MHSRLCTINDFALRQTFQLVVQYVLRILKNLFMIQIFGIFIFTARKSV